MLPSFFQLGDKLVASRDIRVKSDGQPYYSLNARVINMADANAEMLSHSRPWTAADAALYQPSTFSIKPKTSLNWAAPAQKPAAPSPSPSPSPSPAPAQPQPQPQPQPVKAQQPAAEKPAAPEDYEIGALNRMSMFVTHSAKKWVETAAKKSNPTSLWGDGLWFEHEVSCLFSDTNTGKSILAVQIAEHVARLGHRTLYFDFEMSDKQFQLRYTDPGTQTFYEFSPNLFRVELSRERPLGRDIIQIAAAMRQLVETTGATVVIIDNISWLCNEAECGEAAGILMQQLIRLKNELDLSILVLAHTPKRVNAMPLTINCLAGSKKLANFFDSIFAIGKDTSAGPDGRYVKQLKVRSAQLTYHSENVMRFHIERRDAMLQFVREEDNGSESDLIGASGTAGGSRAGRCTGMESQLETLRSEGKSIREIAQMTGIPSSTVGRYFQRQNGAA